MSHVDEYLQCSLYYRYRRELNLPFLGDDIHQLLLASTQRAVRSWFSALGRGLDRVKARNKIARTLKWLWSRDGGDEEGFPLAHARIMECLLNLDRHFHQPDDTAIAGDMPISIAVDGMLYEDIIDGLYLKNDNKPDAKRQDKYFVVVQVLVKNAITSPLVIQMRKAMIRYAINSAMKPNPYPIKLLQIYLPEGTKSWYNLDKHAYDEFIYLARAITRHLNAHYYLPTAHAGSCRVCPYRTICSNKFCEPEVSPQLVGRARNALLRQS